MSKFARSLEFILLLAIPLAANAQPVVTSVVNAASFQPSLSPGTLATVFGSELGPEVAQNLSVTLGGIPCAIIYSAASQINVELPVNAATGASDLVVTFNSATSAAFPVTLNAYAPALSTSDGSGTGLGAFTDGANVVSAGTPAHPGDTIASFGVGLGATNPAVPTGGIAPANPLAVTLVQPVVMIGGIAATVTFSGLAPGAIANYQVNFTIPPNVPIGSQNVTWAIGGITSPAVTIPIAAGSPQNISATGGSSQTASVDTEFPVLLAATVTDADSNPVAGAVVTFAAPAIGPGTTFADGVPTVTTNSSGVASIRVFANDITGSYFVTATVAGIPAVVEFALTNQLPSSAPYVLESSASPSAGGTVTPPSGQMFALDSIVQITATPTYGYTFTGWTGPVADPFAATTTIIMGSEELVTANFIAQVFTDVPPSTYYFNAVNLLSYKAITAGCGVGTYCPQDDVTRAEMAVFIVTGIEGGPNFTYSGTPWFDDVPADAFAFKYIQKMYELGITAGCGGGNYCPNEDVTRAQMAVFIIAARYGSTTQFDYPMTPYFTDVPSNGFAFKWIQRMREDNITAGCGPALYCPNNPVIRGDMAIFIMDGLFNSLLPANEPVLVSVVPASLVAGSANETVTVTGENTNFVQGVTVVNPIPGFTVGVVTVLSPTTLTVSLTAGSTNTAQPESIWVTTGTEEAVIPNAISVDGGT